MSKIENEIVMPGVPQHPLDATTGTAWIMHYKHGPTPHCWKAFELKGSLRDAIKRANEHCQIMGYRLIQVELLLHDLTMEETGKIPMAAAGFQRTEVQIPTR